MKTMVSFAFLFLIATAHVVADAPSLGDFTTVTNLWYEGHKSNVLASDVVVHAHFMHTRHPILEFCGACDMG